MQPDQQDQLNQPQPEQAPQLPYFMNESPTAPVQPRFSKKVLLLVAGILLTTLIIIAGVIVASRDRAGSNDSSRAAAALVENLSNNDYASAYDHFTPELMSIQSLKQFVAQFNADDVLFDSSCGLIISDSSSSKTGSGQDQILGQIVCDDKTYQAQFVFVDNDGAQKLLSYSFKP